MDCNCWAYVTEVITPWMIWMILGILGWGWYNHRVYEITKDPFVEGKYLALLVAMIIGPFAFLGSLVAIVSSGRFYFGLRFW